MESLMPKCKITVLKRTINRDLIEEYIVDLYHNINLCECFESLISITSSNNYILLKLIAL